VGQFWTIRNLFEQVSTSLDTLKPTLMVQILFNNIEALFFQMNQIILIYNTRKSNNNHLPHFGFILEQLKQVINSFPIWTSLN
jgi:hypothetical protein